MVSGVMAGIQPLESVSICLVNTLPFPLSVEAMLTAGEAEVYAACKAAVQQLNGVVDKVELQARGGSHILVT